MRAFMTRVVFALLVVVVDARFVVEKNSITVLSPQKLRTKRDSSMGNLGLRDEGGFMIGSVVYPQKGSLGCQVFEGHKPFKFPSNIPTILLLDRGECDFSLKVWHAQLGGAAAVLVSDSIHEPLITIDDGEESAAEDGYTQNISIPLALIEKSFGDMLKEALNNKDQVLVRIDWSQSIPHPDNKTDMSSEPTSIINVELVATNKLIS